MIGIIIWAILIIFIVICACPGFLTAFFTISLCVVAFMWLCSVIIKAIKK